MKMECLIEDPVKKKRSNRHVSFDYVPSEIDFHENTPTILTFQRKPSRIEELSVEQLYIEAANLSIISKKVTEASNSSQRRTENKHTRNKARRRSVDIPPVPLPSVKFSRDDFSCPYTDDELRDRVKIAWCEHMLKRMNSVGLDFTINSFDPLELERVYLVYKSV